MSAAGIIGSAIVASWALALPVGPAHALDVSSGENGLEMVEREGTADRIELGVIEGGSRYRVVMHKFGDRKVVAGAGCVAETSEVEGYHVVTCTRTRRAVKAELGPGDDSFSVDPSFPDPIGISAGGGDARIRLGAADDSARLGAGGGRIASGSGDDVVEGGSETGVLVGGPGDDRLVNTDGRSSLFGEEGNDALIVRGGRADRLDGGDGKDSFDAGNGGATVINARDGIAERVKCGVPVDPGELDSEFRVALVDLVDTPGDAKLEARGCNRVDRASQGEEPRAAVASTGIRLRDGLLYIRIQCSGAAPCRGVASVRVGSRRTPAVRYKVRGDKTTNVPLLRGSAARRVLGRAARATIVLSERGRRGPRGTRAVVPIKR